MPYFFMLYIFLFYGLFVSICEMGLSWNWNVTGWVLPSTSPLTLSGNGVFCLNHIVDHTKWHGM